MNLLDVQDTVQDAIIAIDRANQIVTFLYDIFEDMDEQNEHAVLFWYRCKRHKACPAVTLGLLTEAKDTLEDVQARINKQHGRTSR